MPLFVRIGMKEEVMRSPYTLWKAGALYAFHTDDPVVASKWLRYCAAMGMRYGMPEDEALKGVTINAATIAAPRPYFFAGDLGASNEVGSVATFGAGPSQQSRTLRMKSSGMNGLPMKPIPGPCGACFMTSSPI
jgi:hypothetical protein